jgi:hypothetical protein
MAMTPQQQAEYNQLLQKRNDYNQKMSSYQTQIDEAQKQLSNPNIGDRRNQYEAQRQSAQASLDSLKAAGEGYQPWEAQRMQQLESGSVAAPSQFAAALQGVPQTPQINFSELLRRRQIGTPEYNAQKAQMNLAEQRQQQMAQRQLLAAQAKAGVRGGAAGAQQERLGEQTSLQRAAAEQGLFVKNLGEREKLEKAQQFGNLSSELARMQLASADLAGQRGLQAASDTAAAQRAAAAGAGGCCMVVAASTALLGIDSAEAAEIVIASKTSGALLKFKHPNAGRFIYELNATRQIRDKWCNNRERRGYYKTAEILVPYIESNSIAANAIYSSFVKPVVACSSGRAGFITRSLVKCWIKLFGIIGGEKPFTRNNGEVV